LTTALGALLGHITGDAQAESYQPMNINFGLFPPLEGKVPKKERKTLLTSRARKDLLRWITEHQLNSDNPVLANA
jgi:methylenetetrahydrofolate--tRNA-(uracil-5-)-methyltransferase